jgi:hypothetical protein
MVAASRPCSQSALLSEHAAGRCSFMIVPIVSNHQPDPHSLRPGWWEGGGAGLARCRYVAKLAGANEVCAALRAKARGWLQDYAAPAAVQRYDGVRLS